MQTAADSSWGEMNIFNAIINVSICILKEKLNELKGNAFLKEKIVHFYPKNKMKDSWISVDNSTVWVK